MTFNLSRLSLRGRYAAMSLLLAISVLASAFMGQQYLSGTDQDTARHIEVRNALLERSRKIRDAVWYARESIEAFLLDPHKAESRARIHSAITEALHHSEPLLDSPWIAAHGLTGEAKMLNGTLLKLNAGAELFVQTRLDAAVAYPSVALARDYMLPAQANFFGAVGLAIDEVSDDDSANAKTVHALFLQTRHVWSLAVSSYRMYLANRVGSFNETTLPEQEQDTDMLVIELGTLLARLGALDKAGRLEFQGSESLGQMRAALTSWQYGYNEVKRTNASGEWRADAKILQHTVYPLLQTIWGNLVTVDSALEAAADNDLGILAKAAGTQSDTLWFLVAVCLAAIIGGYFALEYSILRPLATITDALRSEASAMENVALPEACSLETQHLIDAFSDMRNHVHTRQTALEYQATHDTLTGLPNRNRLTDRLEQAIVHAKRQKSAVALMVLDLDGFKDINDTLGHQIGDDLLKHVGARLQSVLRESDTVARLGGDEFAILINNTTEHQASHVAQKVIDHMQEVFSVEGGHTLYVGASIGIALYPQHGDAAQTLIQRADVAMYLAKHNKGGYGLYDPAADTHSVDRLALVTDLREALNSNSLELYYQPQINIAKRRTIGVEALLRWNHPTRGFVPPTEIIPVAEQTGLIKPLTSWVLKEALRQCSEWRAQGLDLQVAINLSVHNLQNDEIVAEVLHHLAAYDVPPHLLILEITESAMMADPERAISVLSRLNTMGIQMAIDDFGTGFSSLAYLKRLPVDEIKVDRSFVMDMHHDENDAVIVRSTIDLAHNLGLRVVAEGVENEEILQLLTALGCDTAQGYHFSRPVAPAQFVEWLAKQPSV